MRRFMAPTQLPTPDPLVPPQHNPPNLDAAMPRCKGCDLYLHATQAVPGAGSSRAKLMLVGEQPGNEEDKQGAPFVGPAGRRRAAPRDGRTAHQARRRVRDERGEALQICG